MYLCVLKNFTNINNKVLGYARLPSEWERSLSQTFGCPFIPGGTQGSPAASPPLASYNSLPGLPWQNTADCEASTTETHLLTILEPRSLRSRCPQKQFLLRLLSLVCRWPSPPWAFRWSSLCVCLCVRSSYTDSTHIGFGSPNEFM